MQTASPPCPTCSADLPSGASFCPRCGSATPTNYTGGAATYRAPESGADATRQQELQRLLGPGYELRGLIGRGGFADVYEAWDIRLKRPLAVKTMRTDLEISEALLERFRHEAEAIARLRHPNVIPIYLVGGEGNVAFFVMPKIDGESLAARLVREPKLDVDEGCRILREAAGALAAAHEAGMIHRDVKPENIMLDGPQRRVLVTDFGIAKNAVPGEKGLTGTGMMIGTPHYMSPEQAVGERSIDHRSDQYSLAVVGYKVLSGELPIDGESMQALIYKQVTEMPRPLTEVAPDVPAQIGDVLQKALAKDPRDRFGSMDAFDRALAGAASGAPVVTGHRQRVDDLQTRIANMRKALPGWKSPTTAGALVLGVLGAWLGLRSDSPIVRTLAADREEAIFAARTFVVNRGVAPPFQEATTWDRADDARLTFLAKNAPEVIEQRIASYAPYWYWHVRLRPDGKNATTWHVVVGPASRIGGFHRILPDTAPAPTVSDTAAAAVATRELSALRVPDAAALTRMRDSTVRLSGRTDHIIRWQRSGSAIGYRGDTSHARVSMRVVGSEVTEYNEELMLPRSWTSEDLNAATASILALGVLIGIVGYAWILVRQMKHDELQWRTGIIVGVMLMGLGFPDWIASEMRSLFMEGFNDTSALKPTPIIDIVGQTVLLFMGSLGLGAVAAVAESLSAELRPRMFWGIGDLTRGRFRTPEFVSAVTLGGLAGLALVALVTGIDNVSLTLSGMPSSLGVNPVVTSAVPPLSAMQGMSMAGVAALCLGAFQLGVLRLRNNSKWAIAIPSAVLLVAVASTSPNGSTPGELVRTAAQFIATVFIVWRYGVLAGAVASVVAQGVPALVTMFLYGSGGATHATLTAAVYAVPFILALVAWRHLTAAAGRVPTRITAQG